MIFRQLFDSVSGTYTYLIASRHGGEALIIDPVLEKVDRYLQLVRELEFKLVKAVDTHLHADHVTGPGALRDRTHCITVMGEQTHADVVSMRVTEGDCIEIDGFSLAVLYTPRHTDDSYSFLMGDRVFTGDTLLIRGCHCRKSNPPRSSLNQRLTGKQSGNFIGWHQILTRDLSTLRATLGLARSPMFWRLV